jgi:hypothetical protein
MNMLSSDFIVLLLAGARWTLTNRAPVKEDESWRVATGNEANAGVFLEEEIIMSAQLNIDATRPRRRCDAVFMVKGRSLSKESVKHNQAAGVLKAIK